VRKSFLVFLAGVIGGSVWLFLQNYKFQGLEGVQVQPRGKQDESAPLFPVSTPANTSRDVIRIASFNIKVFGTAKLGNPVVMDILARIVRQFDLVAIQEIRSRDDDILPRFVEQLNAGGRHYDFVIGPRLGRTNSKEQYAFVFDQQTIEVNRTQLYTVNDPDDVLHREPLVSWFRARAAPPEQAFTFSLINIHTDPDEVDREMDVLDDVFRAVRDDGRQEDDAILLGDFNTDERHFGQLGRVPNLRAVIPANVPTNTLGTKSYDNLVFDQLATTEYTGRAGVFDFLHEGFNLSQEVAQDVSDHKPVWAEFSVYEGGTAGRIAALPR
jgi:endonuclease/exonuclease/phosphatase family metal-dependent hydrolase